ncbi:MAG: hypothetical protein EHM45_07030 [Desulfobacteraceae bacterium]|nr:MAG: hypothetical protein EHM45_07030 [Desulfobacteraceae bacterium]
MQWRVVEKTAIQKVFTAMIALFLITLILLIARSYVIGSLCLVGFCFLFWKWRQYLGEEIILTLLMQNAGHMRFNELLERFTEKQAEEILARLQKKGLVRKDEERVVLIEQGPPANSVENPEAASSKSGSKVEPKP